MGQSVRVRILSSDGEYENTDTLVDVADLDGFVGSLLGKLVRGDWERFES